MRPSSPFLDREVLVSLFKSAIRAATPAEVISHHLPQRARGRTVVIGAGKASSQMAAAFEIAWQEPVGGLVVTRYGHSTKTRQIEVLEAAHPIPDEAGLRAAKRMMRLVSGLGSEDLVVALMSGGGSALLPAPALGLTLNDERLLTGALLASGAPISAMNRIRAEISQLKAGRLASLAFPARVETLVVSDVPGDDPADVAGGPTVAPRDQQEDVLELVARHRLELPPRVLSFLKDPKSRVPKPDVRRFSPERTRVIASANLSLRHAAARARAMGLEAHIISDAIEGEARDVARVFAAISRNIAMEGQPFAPPCFILSGGETTVTLRGNGRGGRNTEFLLAFAIAIEGTTGITALAADTDGIDGSEDNAGAFADGQSAARMRAAGVDPAVALASNNSYGAFAATSDLFTTGPTGTNVNDFRAILVR